ncbi:MAG: bifunctional diguanylate cyclase/phosphodiesterase [Oscillospiraceae bacterium]|nr:bifunctional diguanylate cyclase/phosphodiesterase [Oscillospiraceae bacterium]MDY2848098.1 bifunctional diguanylate cyclase/phosphodiesterase [Oscillospiraceae bacterium]
MDGSISENDIRTEELLSKINELSLKLSSEKARYAVASKFVDFGIWEYDIASTTQYMIKKLEGKFSEKLEPIEGFCDTIIGSGSVYPDDIPVFRDFCERMDRGEPEISCEIRMYSDEYEYRWLHHEGLTVCDDSGRPVKVTGITVDVTESHSNLNDRSVKKDSVTGLMSRESGEQAVIVSMSKLPSSREAALIIFDLDGFDGINDNWGRLYGDFVLETFSNILKSCASQNDIIYRISGDEFAVLKRIDTASEIDVFFEKVHERYNTFSFPRGGNFHVTAGAVRCNNETSFEELMRRADIALYKAKSSGRGGVTVYSEGMDAEGASGMSALKDYSAEQNLSVKLLSGSEKRLYDFAFDMFSKCSEPDEAIEYIFPEIGKYFNIDNIIIIEKKLSGKVEISYCWRRGVLYYDDESFVSFYTGRWPVLEDYFRSNGYYAVSWDDKNISGSRRAVMDKYKIKGAVRCPLFDGNDLVGFISYELINESRKWSDSEINALCTLSKMLSVYLLKFRSSVNLNNANFYTEAMLENQRLVCYGVDPSSWEITYISPYAVNRFPNIKIGEKCFRCIMDDDSPCKNCPIFGLEEDSDRFQNEVYNEKYSCWFRCTVTRMKNPDGEENYLVCVNDITAYLERVNSKDRLTGLMTFERFTSEAGKALYNRRRYAVAVISINKFRGINEKYGIRIGNILLTEFARRLSASAGEDEYVCRWGGGKFILLLRDKGELEDVKQRIGEIISTASADIFSITGIHVGFYSGMYRIPDDDYQLVADIDKANSARKTISADYSLENSVGVYDDDQNRDALDRKHIESIMQEALENHEFRAFYQPKVRLADGRITGAEALVRWIRPGGEFISPGRFIPTFEENGFITEMDFEIYRQVFSDLRRWIDEGKNVPVVSVNVSRRHFIGDDFPQKIEALRKEYDIPHKYIELEITESMFSNNLNHVISIVNILRDYGFLISVDDFGSGYSNLNLITKMPVDILKVDGGFFINHELSNKDKAVISTIISLAHSLNLYVVSEGIENKIQVDFLNESGCDVVQGFFFYKPMERESFEKLISGQN